MSVEPIFVTVEETTKILGLSKSRIYELLASRELRRVKHGRSTLIPYEDVRRFADELIRRSA